MMIADLIDQDDYRERLKAVGVPLDADWTPEQCSAAALSWFENQDAQACADLYRLIQELRQQHALLLPEVKAALNTLAAACPL